jgi:hypothetical protein
MDLTGGQEGRSMDYIIYRLEIHGLQIHNFSPCSAFLLINASMHSRVVQTILPPES